MDHYYFKKITPKMLGTALLFYILVVTLLFTLAPYEYSFTDLNNLRRFFGWDLEDSIMNIILFIPIGFLLFPILPAGKKFSYAALLGLLFSCFIEFNQIFIPSRSPGINDILTNSAGALLGSLGHHYADKFARGKSDKLLNLGIPLINILFLMIPLLWLSSFAAGYELKRLWLLLFLGFSGAVLLSEIYINRISRKGVRNLILFLFLLAMWYFIGVFPALLRYPQRIMPFLILIIVFTALRMKYGRKVKNDNRFELKTLNKIIPIFIFYILLLSQWPLELPDQSFKFNWLTDYKMQRDYFISLYRYVEYFAAFAMVGYLLAQYINRSKNQLNKSGRVIMWLLILTILLEIPRGFHPAYSATMENVIVSFAWGIFGAGIYLMQLDYFKFVKEKVT